MKTIKVNIGNDVIINRVPTFTQGGNFVITTIRYKKDEYIVGDGDEYIRDGYDKVFTLGKNLGPYKK